MMSVQALQAAARKLEALDETSRFAAAEIRLIELGVTRSAEALATTDHLGAGLWRRLAIEATLRLTWIAGDDLPAEAAGPLVLDASVIRNRVARLRARDVLHLLAAYNAVQEEPDKELVDGMTELAAALSTNPAPPNLRALVTNKPQRAMYAQHRMSSALIHPGAAIGDRRGFDLMVGRLEEITALAGTFAGAVAKALSRGST
jgi:hypothetical protein